MKIHKICSLFTKSLLFSICLLFGLNNFVLAAPGDLDKTFGNGGKVISPIGKFSADYGFATAVQSDGKIIVAGRSVDGAYANFMIARLNTDGTLDTSFGSNGYALKKSITTGYALAMVIQPDGKIVVGGYAFQINGYYNVFTIVRFNSDGTIDSSFGVDGVAQSKPGTANNSCITSLALQSDGKIVAAGFSYINYTFQPSSFDVARFNSDGKLDNTFGKSGSVSFALNTNTKANAVVIQPDGKILVGGYADNFSKLVRLNNDGSLDTNFDSDGIVLTQIGSSSGIGSLVLQNNGKIVAAGSNSNGASSDIAVARYNSDGSLDNTFDSDGIVTTDFNNQQEGASAVKIQADGKIVLSGTTAQSNSPDTRDFLAVRYNPNGSLDTSFGNGGKVITNISPADEQANAVVIQPDGKIILVGYSFQTTYDVAVLRYNSDGSLDNTFSNNGISLIELGNGVDIIFATAIQADGRIVAVGYSYDGVYRNITVVRYNTNGTFDNSFGNNGVVVTSLGQNASEARKVLIQPDGKILVGGNINPSTANSDFAVLRYNSDGSLDNNFDSDGIVIVPVGNNTDALKDIALQNDGKIVAVGQARITSTYNFAVVRINSDGSLDTNFGNSGKVFTAVTSGINISYSIAIQNDGKLIVGGYGYVDSITGSDFVLVRYNLDGTLDNTFDGDGKVTTNFDGAAEDVINAVVIQNDGKIVAGGYSNTNFALARYNSDGSLDTSFDGDGKVKTDFASNYLNNQIYDLAIQSDGKIVAVGAAIFTDNRDSVIARYNLNGSPDATFGNGGVIIASSDKEDDEFVGVSIQSDGKIVAGGYSSNGANYDFTLFRYLGDIPANLRKRIRVTF